MKKGRKRKSDALKRLEGNPGHRHLRDDDEVKVSPRSGPRCPSKLSKNARKEWQRAIAPLVATGLVRRGDRAVAAAFCQSWACWYEIEQAIAGHVTILVDGPHGAQSEQLNPLVKASKQYYDAMMRAAGALGLSPADRSSVDFPKIAKGKVARDELTPPPRWIPPRMLAETKRHREKVQLQQKATVEVLPAGAEIPPVVPVAVDPVVPPVIAAAEAKVEPEPAAGPVGDPVVVELELGAPVKKTERPWPFPDFRD